MELQRTFLTKWQAVQNGTISLSILICKCCSLLRHIPRQMVTFTSSTGVALRPSRHRLCFQITRFQPILMSPVTELNLVPQRHKLRSALYGLSSAQEILILNGISGVDQPAHLLRVLEIGAVISRLDHLDWEIFGDFLSQCSPKVSKAAKAACLTTGAQTTFRSQP